MLSPALDFQNLRVSEDILFILIFIQKLNQTEILNKIATVVEETPMEAVLLLMLLAPIELRSTRVALLATVAS